MGDRYYLTVVCPTCGFTEKEVYYAPTCGFTKHKCKKCGKIINLEKYSGISYKDASNRDLMEAVVGCIDKRTSTQTEIDYTVGLLKRGEKPVISKSVQRRLATQFVDNEIWPKAVYDFKSTDQLVRKHLKKMKEKK